MKLVDSNAEQDLLEEILDQTKPALPEECRHLDYLLSTPFRYRPYPKGSRFRRAGLTPGVWYGAECPETAVAEMAFYRILFYAESPLTPFPDNAAEYTAVSAALDVAVAIDLTIGRLLDQRDRWSHPTDYAPCQEIADVVRRIGGDVIRYASARDPEARANLAVLSCSAFAGPTPIDRQTWRIRLGVNGALALREHPRLALEFGPASFAGDPRLQAMVWDRLGQS